MTKGESHTRHFNVNYGMPYKFIAATATLPFEGAAQAITDTRSRLNWAAKELLQHHTPAKTSHPPPPNPLQPSEPVQSTQHAKSAQATALDDFKPFNEVLALGYFSSQKICYHNDGEHGLGPTIATLSLGSPGTMRLRMKDKHYHGVSKSGVYTDAPPLPGSSHYEERLALMPHLEQLKATGRQAYAKRLKEVPKELELGCKGHAKDAVTMVLAHGDVVVMHGAGVQRYFEHSVENAGKLRFALTCRYIDPESLR